jgi:hypothetical protein
VQRHLVQQLRLGQLAAQHRRSERCGIDRAAQLAPQPRHRAQMILMRMGNHEATQPVAPFGDEAGIWHHDFDLGQGGAPEADAAIDRKPCAVAAIEVEIHADLARPAKRQEGQISSCGVHSILSCCRQGAC